MQDNSFIFNCLGKEGIFDLGLINHGDDIVFKNLLNTSPYDRGKLEYDNAAKDVYDFTEYKINAKDFCLANNCDHYNSKKEPAKGFVKAHVTTNADIHHYYLVLLCSTSNLKGANTVFDLDGAVALRLPYNHDIEDKIQIGIPSAMLQSMYTGSFSNDETVLLKESFMS